jgi:4-hydroxy-2-oxoglutarate aldolase
MDYNLPDGIYPPVPTFFDEQEELDLATLRRHMQRIADSGIAGYVLMGSNGEAVHLSAEERAQVIRTAREVVGHNTRMPLIAGCGDHSTRATIAHCRQAADNGADIALILPPAYYKSNMQRAALLAHYRAVADASPLPILIYNMPASTGGLDLDAETITLLARHPRIIGLKDSSANVTKLAQVVDAVRPSFRVFAGSASFLLPALAVGAVGAVAALANVLPREVCAVQTLFTNNQLAEARRLQAALIAPNNAVTTLFGVPGLKAALEQVAGYGGKPRMPLQPLGEQERQRVKEIFKPFLAQNM